MNLLGSIKRNLDDDENQLQNILIENKKAGLLDGIEIEYLNDV